MKTRVGLFVIGITLILTLVIAGCSKTVEVDQNILSEKISQYANPAAVITPDQLQTLMEEEEDLIIIGVLSPAKALIPGNIASTPIEGSYTVWRNDYSGNGSLEAISEEVNGYRKSIQEMEELLSKAGATPDSEIVVYAADAHHDAARFIWQVSLLGHENISYLDGGLNAWVGSGYPTGKGITLAQESLKTEYQARKYATAILEADIEILVEALKNPEEWVVIDTRSKDEYDGKETGSSKGAYGTGRIKDSINIEWTEAVNDDTTLKSLQELEQIYGDTIKGKKVIVFCQSGVRSAHTYAVLTEVLGKEEVYNYDGSWIEWSYAASEDSKGKVDDGLRAEVLELTELWTDNKGAI